LAFSKATTAGAQTIAMTPFINPPTELGGVFTVNAYTVVSGKIKD
jgi:hypothetical protein